MEKNGNTILRQSPRVSAQQEFQANTHSVNRADGTEGVLVTNAPQFFYYYRKENIKMNRPLWFDVKPRLYQK